MPISTDFPLCFSKNYKNGPLKKKIADEREREHLTNLLDLLKFVKKFANDGEDKNQEFAFNTPDEFIEWLNNRPLGRVQKDLIAFADYASREIGNHPSNNKDMEDAYYQVSLALKKDPAGSLLYNQACFAITFAACSAAIFYYLLPSEREKYINLVLTQKDANNFSASFDMYAILVLGVLLSIGSLFCATHACSSYNNRGFAATEAHFLRWLDTFDAKFNEVKPRLGM